ncbi:hypothetical protein RA269_27700, partial [Pseudomonas syringae pv. tagetis]|uniref:hypothetical protein n=1 Tax=Pseudomonas syringae group genomosp. 7 TaxID=251699 RepID=UPI00376FCF98
MGVWGFGGGFVVVEGGVVGGFCGVLLVVCFGFWVVWLGVVGVVVGVGVGVWGVWGAWECCVVGLVVGGLVGVVVWGVFEEVEGGGVLLVVAVGA